MVCKVRNRIQTRARQMVQKAIQSGLLKRGKVCHKCGDTHNIIAHHQNYCRYLDVIWLCQSCHCQLHWDSRLRLVQYTFDTQVEIDIDRNQTFSQYKHQLTISPTIFGRLHNYA